MVWTNYYYDFLTFLVPLGRLKQSGMAMCRYRPQLGKSGERGLN